MKLDLCVIYHFILLVKIYSGNSQAFFEHENSIRYEFMKLVL